MPVDLEKYKIKQGVDLNKYKINQTPIDIPKPISTGRALIGELGQVAKNVPKDIGEIIGGIGQAIAHPIQTAKGVASMGLGFVEKIIPGEQKHEASFNVLTDMLKERYGSWEGFTKYVKEHPVQYASDVSALISMAGKGVQVAGQVSKAGKLAKVGSSIYKAGEAIDPLLAGVKAGTALVKGRKIAPFANAVDVETMRIASEKGLTLPLGAQTKSRFVQLQEVLASKGMFGRKIANQLDDALNQISDIGDDIIRKTDGVVDSEQAGKAIIQGLEEQKKAFIDMKNKLYNEVLPLKGKYPTTAQRVEAYFDPALKKQGLSTGALYIQAPQTQNILFSYVDELKRASKLTSKKGNLQLYQSLETSLKGGKATARDFYAALKQINQSIKEPTSFVVQGDTARLMKLASTMSDDLDNFLKMAAEKGRINPAIVAGLDEANEFYKTNITQLNNRLTSRIKAVATQPDKVFNIVMQPTTGIDEMRQIVKVLTPDDLNNVRATTLSSMINKAKSKTTDFFTASGLQRQIDNIGRNKMEILFMPEQIKSLDDLTILSKSMQRVTKIASGSQTAFLQRNLSLIETIGGVALAFRNLPAALSLFLGDIGINKFLTSQTGRKLLLEGIDISGKTGGRISQFGHPILQGLFQTGRATETTP